MSIEPDRQRPRLRDIIDIQPIIHVQQPYLLLRDTLELTPKHLLLPQHLAPLLSLCDGTRNINGLQASLLIRFGLQVSKAEIDRIIQSLDEACLLDNDHFQKARDQALLDYRQAPFRPPVCAPHVYPDSPSELQGLLESYLESARAAHLDRPFQAVYPSLRGIISPHIDYARGGLVYARTWLEAGSACRAAEVAVIFGTDHYGNELLTLTRQHYVTPYGLLPTDQQAVQALAEAVGAEMAFAGELRHRKEHSIELAAVWLHHLRGGEPIGLVPILCTYPENADDHDRAERFLTALAAFLEGKRALIIAAADLSHVGPAFGGPPLDGLRRASLKDADDRLIEPVLSGDAASFLDQIVRTRNKTNVCGAGPIYFILRGLAPTRGELISYASCPADQHDTSAVTICGMLLQ